MQITLQRSGVKTLVAGGRASTQAMSEGNLGMTESRNATGLGVHGALTWGGFVIYLHLTLVMLGSRGRDLIRREVRIIP